MNRMMKLQQARAHESGFTLVELAIVLVIIGLIVGGVLVGQDLIKAAEIRATTSDLERYNAAANTFRNKYDGVPGDLLANRAANYGLTARNEGGEGAGHGDGNGLVEGCSQASVYLGCETAIFWRDLTDAQLIGDAFVTATDALADAADIGEIGEYLPAAPLRDTAFISVYPQSGRNYYSIAAFSAVATGEQNFAARGVQALSMLEASQIDDKIDDGAPLTGIVRAIYEWEGTGGNQGAAWDTGATGATGVCVDNTAGADDDEDAYFVSNTDLASELNCAISIRSSF